MADQQLKYRAVIEFLLLEGQAPKEIHARLTNVYRDLAPSLATVYNWVAEFRRGRKSIQDEPPLPQPRTVRTPENLKKLEEIVMTDRRLKLSVIANIMGIPKSTIHLMLTEDLMMRKVSARWVPKLLTPHQKQDRVDISNENLELVRTKKNFLSTLVTGDETWVHYYDPETKQASMQWKHKDSPPPKKGKVQKSQKKLLLTVFWDYKGPLLIKFHPRNTTINGALYAETLAELRQSVLQKRGTNDRYWANLLQDNAPPHTSRIARTAADQQKFTLISHPPYSPDLAPSDYYLFRHLKSVLKGQRFEDDEEIVAAVNSFFESREESFYNAGIMSLPSKWEKCIKRGGDYIEK